MIESVDLVIWTTEGENLEINLEAWQVEAIQQVLGMDIQTAPGNAYDISMFSQKTVTERLKKLGVLKKFE